MSDSLARERADRIVKSDAEWRAQLTPEQYRITRQHGGPHETAGPRHCINGAALTFKPGDP